MPNRLRLVLNLLKNTSFSDAPGVFVFDCTRALRTLALLLMYTEILITVVKPHIQGFRGILFPVISVSDTCFFRCYTRVLFKFRLFSKHVF